MFSCDNVITIPQYKDTSWFNAILMSIFYSQHSRKMLYNHFEGKKDKFSRIMNDIIKHNYIKSEQSNEYFKFMRPENILKYMNLNTQNLFDIFKNQESYYYNNKLFLPFFLKSLNKNVLDVIIFDNNCYGNFYSALEAFSINYEAIDISKLKVDVNSDDLKNPDYIIVHKIPDDDGTEESDLENVDLYLKIFLNIFISSQDEENEHLQGFDEKLNLARYDIEGLREFKNKIVFDDNTYVLDSVILNNEISGITCKNEHFVYSSQLRKTTDKDEVLPCELVKFNWDVNRDNKFCLNSKKCKLDAPTKEDVCYSFNDIKYATLIYVKENADVMKSVDKNLSLTSSLTLPSLKSNSHEFLLDFQNDEEKIERKRKQKEFKKRFNATSKQEGHEEQVAKVAAAEEKLVSCQDIITIPQTKGTCWFNAILMSIFYSQNSRKLLYHNFEGKTDKFSRIMNDIIKHNYIKSKDTIDYFKFMKPENILKYINVNNKEQLFKQFKANKSYGFSMNTFLPHFLKSLNKNVLDVIIYKNNCYANFYSLFDKFITESEVIANTSADISKWSGEESEDITNPDYLIVHKTSDSDKDPYRSYFRIKTEFFEEEGVEKKINLENYGIKIKDISKLNDKIEYNGNVYILDSILLDNYNRADIGLGHAIAGITCKNKRFVYNGWMRTIPDGESIPRTYGNNLLPCELFEFDWNIKKGASFCLNTKLCMTEKVDKKKLCFSFKQLDKITLVYVKQIAQPSVDRNLSITSSLTLPSLKDEKSDYSEIDDRDMKKIQEYIVERRERKGKQEAYKKRIFQRK